MWNLDRQARVVATLVATAGLVLVASGDGGCLQAADPAPPRAGDTAADPAADAARDTDGLPDTAGPATAAGLAFFESRIRPVLVEHCQECHAAAAAGTAGRPPRGGLRLDSRAGVLAGGDSGSVIDFERPDRSLLVQALRYDGFEMPPSGRLPDRVADDFVAWIRLGAPDPRVLPPEGTGDHAARGPAQPTIDVEAGRSFWAFRPLASSTPPEVRDGDWPLTDTDRFILAGLEARGLAPVADAERSAWLRRVTFDLVGLPPTPEELAAFAADESPAAHVRVVDRLLAAGEFGERWGRHWLDVARFAESSGGGRSMVFPEAWRYRDWVIDAFNVDLPYDRFVVAQIAGDLLPAESTDEAAANLVATGYLVLGATNYEEQDKKALEMDVVDEQLDTIGRGLLGMTLGCARCHDHKFDPVPTSDYYAMAGIFRSTSLLVHDNVSRWKERPLPLDPATAAAVAAHEADLAAAKARLAAAKSALAGIDPSGAGPAVVAAGDLPGIVLDDGQARRVGEWVASQYTKRYIGAGYLHDGNAGKGAKTLTFQPEFTAAGLHEVRLAYTANDNRATNVPVSLLTLDGEIDLVVNMRRPPPIDGRFVSLGTFRFDGSNQWFVMVSNEGTDGYVIVDAVQFLPVAEVPATASTDPAVATDAARTDAVAAARADVARLEREVKDVAARAPRVPRAMAVEDVDSPIDQPLLVRGNVHTPGRVVPRGVLRVATLGAAPAMPADSSGRLELARWITAAEHPLTARVWVNRVWTKLFGAGLVRTVDNFGSTGETPSHPELLDFLARRFMEDGWSTKALIRSLVLSRAYRLAAVDDPAGAAIDPENRLLWRMHRRRLDAESLRDAILSVAGTLELGTPLPKVDRAGSPPTGSARGGPGITDPKVLGAAGSDAPSEYGYQFTDTRRSVYTPAFRNRRLELFEAFDGADPNAVAGERTVSTVAPQALYLLNSPFIMAQSRAAAERLLAATPGDGTPSETTRTADAAGSDAARLEAAFLATLARPPRAGEREAVLRSLSAATADADRDPVADWARVFQALFGCVDFRSLD